MSGHKQATVPTQTQTNEHHSDQISLSALKRQRD